MIRAKNEAALNDIQLAWENIIVTSNAPLIGPVELRILQALDRSKRRVWRVGQDNPHGLSDIQLRQSLHYLTKAGLLERIERGVYFVPPRSGRILISPLELVGAWFADEPHAVVGHAAAEQHRLTLDVSSVVEVQLTRKKHSVAFQGVLYVFSQMARPRLVADNVKVVFDSSTTLVASPGKLVVQLLTNTSSRRSSRATRDTGLVLDVLEAGKRRGLWVRVDWPRLVQRHGTASTVRRLGYLLEQLGIGSAESLLPMRGESGNVVLSPVYPMTGPIDKRWRLVINDPAVS